MSLEFSRRFELGDERISEISNRGNNNNRPPRLPEYTPMDLWGDMDAINEKINLTKK